MPDQLTASLVLGGKAVTSIKVPVEGKLSDAVKQLRETAMKHVNAHLAATDTNIAEEVDLLEETVSDDEDHKGVGKQ